MKPSEASKLIDTCVTWLELVDRHRDNYRRHVGIVTCVAGKNVMVGNRWWWLPNMVDLQPYPGEEKHE